MLRPFEQVESALSRRHGGTGLGLPYSKKVIEIHGGKLILASQGRHRHDGACRAACLARARAREQAESQAGPSICQANSRGTCCERCHDL